VSLIHCVARVVLCCVVLCCVVLCCVVLCCVVLCVLCYLVLFGLCCKYCASSMLCCVTPGVYVVFVNVYEYVCERTRAYVCVFWGEKYMLKCLQCICCPLLSLLALYLFGPLLSLLACRDVGLLHLCYLRTLCLSGSVSTATQRSIQPLACPICLLVSVPRCASVCHLWSASPLHCCPEPCDQIDASAMIRGPNPMSALAACAATPSLPQSWRWATYAS